jgi:hypothetical protein
MNKSLRMLGLTAAASASIISGAAGTASAAQPAQASGGLACPYRYVVTDGKPNNVIAYKGPLGTGTQSKIRPNGHFVVFFGFGNRIAGRQQTDHGWVSFPRSYLRPSGPCGGTLLQASNEVAILSGAAKQATGDIGKGLGNVARSRR